MSLESNTKRSAFAAQSVSERQAESDDALPTD